MHVLYVYRHWCVLDSLPSGNTSTASLVCTPRNWKHSTPARSQKALNALVANTLPLANTPTSTLEFDCSWLPLLAWPRSAPTSLLPKVSYAVASHLYPEPLTTQSSLPVYPTLFLHPHVSLWSTFARNNAFKTSSPFHLRYTLGSRYKINLDKEPGNDHSRTTREISLLCNRTSFSDIPLHSSLESNKESRYE